MADTINVHACAIAVGGFGVLIAGPSGAGKTTLALALVEACARSGMHGCWLADDRVLLAAAGGRLVAAAPPAIAGLAEVRGFGPAPVGHVPAMVVDLCVRLVDEAQAERLPAARSERICGLDVPRLDLSARHETGAVRAVLARLGLPPFDGPATVRGALRA